MSKYVKVVRQYDLEHVFYCKVADEWDGMYQELPDDLDLGELHVVLDDLNNYAEEDIVVDVQPPEGAKIIDLTANTTGETKQGQPSQD